MDWRIKLGAQFVFARAPFGRQMNHALQVLNGSHSAPVVRRRLLELASNVARIREAGLRIEGSCIVEIGTGWDAIGALVLFALGAETIHTFDHLPHLRSRLVRLVMRELESCSRELAACAGVAPELVQDRLRQLAARRDSGKILMQAGVRYHAPADAARTGLPPSSVDLVYTNDVLEHVDRETLRLLNRESRRLLRPGGLAYHNIGLHDHYVSIDRHITAVHFLTYSDRWWDFFVQNDISYHNRLREKDFLEIFRRDGFEIAGRRRQVDAASLQALDRMRIDARFRGYTKEELAVTRSELILKPRSAA